MVTQENIIGKLHFLIRNYEHSIGLYNASVDGDNNSASVAFSVANPDIGEDDPVFLIYSKDIKDVTDEM